LWRLATYHPTSTRAQEIVDAWNEGRLADLMAGHSDDVSVIGIAPKTRDDRQPVSSVGRDTLEHRLKEVMTRRHTFELVSALDAADLISLVLRDQDGDLFTVSLGLNPDGKIARIVSVRTT
jgi:hypothetical protein